MAMITDSVPHTESVIMDYLLSDKSMLCNMNKKQTYPGDGGEIQ